MNMMLQTRAAETAATAPDWAQRAITAYQKRQVQQEAERAKRLADARFTASETLVRGLIDMGVPVTDIRLDTITFLQGEGEKVFASISLVDIGLTAQGVDLAIREVPVTDSITKEVLVIVERTGQAFGMHLEMWFGPIKSAEDFGQYLSGAMPEIESVTVEFTAVTS